MGLQGQNETAGLSSPVSVLGLFLEEKKGDDAKKDQMPERLEIKTVLSERGRMAGHRFMRRGDKTTVSPPENCRPVGWGT